MTDAPKLKPCPFCGSVEVYLEICPHGGDKSALCLSCGATAFLPAWNTRSDLSKALVRAGYLAGLKEAGKVSNWLIDFADTDNERLALMTFIETIQTLRPAGDEAIAAIVARVTETGQ